MSTEKWSLKYHHLHCQVKLSYSTELTKPDHQLKYLFTTLKYQDFNKFSLPCSDSMLRYLLFESIHTKQVNLISYHASDVQDVTLIAENHSLVFTFKFICFFKITKFAKTSACMFLFTNIVQTKTPSICFNQHIVTEKFSVVFYALSKQQLHNTTQFIFFVMLLFIMLH